MNAGSGEDVPDFLNDQHKTEYTATHDVSSFSETDSQSEGAFSATDEEREKIAQERMGISNSILRKKTELLPKAINFLIFALLFLVPFGIVAVSFYVLVSNTSVLQENSVGIYKTCRLPGDVFILLFFLSTIHFNDILQKKNTKNIQVLCYGIFFILFASVYFLIY